MALNRQGPRQPLTVVSCMDNVSVVPIAQSQLVSIPMSESHEPRIVRIFLDALVLIILEFLAQSFPLVTGLMLVAIRSMFRTSVPTKKLESAR